MAASFLFYDLETSGFDAHNDRIMQFAGIRTDSNLEQVGEPYNIIIRMTPEVVPSPDAIMVTGITPQSTISDGMTEAEFLKYFYDEIVQPDTCFLGFNTVRFDDEFMRTLHYRNFYDPYEWQWADGCSRWDILDAVRMTRALRPDGIVWPFTPEGKPTNRLELITKLNGIDHYAAHDALSDVHATIAVAKLIRDKQPKLFNFLHENCGKKAIQKMVDQDAPFVYSSGRYPSEYEKTAVVARVAANSQGRGVYVYDLRHDPSEFVDLSVEQLLDRMQYTKDETAPRRLPVKMLQYNHCPAVAPMGVLDDASRERLKIDLPTVQRHLHALKLAIASGFDDRITQAMKRKDENRDAYIASKGNPDVDAQIYNGFLQPGDKQLSRAIRVAQPQELMSFESRLSDERLKKLLPRYKARNYPESLTVEEREAWEQFCRERLLNGGNQSPLARYFTRLQELAATASPDKSFLLEELQLYGQSIMPVYDGE